MDLLERKKGISMIDLIQQYKEALRKARQMWERVSDKKSFPV